MFIISNKKSHSGLQPSLTQQHNHIILSEVKTTMAIANGTCVSFCNQPKAHFGLTWVHPGTIAVNVTWMKRGFNACQMHRSIYPSIFNRFPVIQPVSSKVRHFSTFWPPLGTPLGQSRQMLHGSKEDSMLVKRIAAYTHLSSTVSELWRDIGWKLQLFPTPLHLTPPLWVFPLEFQE